jgi:hypothetical protein
MISVVLVAYYWALFGVIDGLLSAVGLGWNVEWIVWAAFAVIAGPLWLGVVVITGQSLKKNLYPDVAGVRSRYHELAGHRRFFVIVIFGLAVPVGAIAFLLTAGIASWLRILLGVLLLVYLAIVSATASPPSEPAMTGTFTPSALLALWAAFVEGGYDVFSPRTGDPEIDPLLVEIDLFARRAGRGLVVQIKQREAGSAKPLAWTESTAVTTAARVLELQIADREVAAAGSAGLLGGVRHVEPLLVLIDVEADESLRNFCSREHVHVLTVQTANRWSGLIDPDHSHGLDEIARRFAVLLSEPEQYLKILADAPASVSADKGPAT